MQRIKKWLPLISISLALAIVIIDGTVLNVSINDLARSLNTTYDQIQLSVTIYTLVVATLTITGGRIGDLYGRKKIFLIGTGIFMLGSLIASFSTSISILILGWSILEGIGAALMLPATASLLISTYKSKSERSIAFGIWGSIAGASAALGPILGGYLTTNYSWHWAFRINIVVGLVLIVLGYFYINEYKEERKKQDLDEVGVLLSALGLGSLVYGIINTSTYGWVFAKESLNVWGRDFAPFGISPSFIFMLLGLIIIVVFIWWEDRMSKKGRIPLIALSIFKNKQFSAGIITNTAVALAQSGIIFTIPIFLQVVLGLNAFDTGLALLPLSIGVFIVAPLSSKLSEKFGAKYLVVSGLILMTLSSIILERSLSPEMSTKELIPGLLIFGLGMGVIVTQLSNLTLSAVDVDQAGQASGINNTSRQFGSSIGTALIGTIFLGAIALNTANEIRGNEDIPEAIRESIAVEIENDGNAILGNNRSEESKSINPYGDTVKAVYESAKKGFTESNKDSLEFTTFLLGLSIIAALSLPNIKLNASSKSVSQINH